MVERPGKSQQICKRCVMDSTDPTIVFDKNGYCNYCNYAISTMSSRWLNNNRGKVILDRIIEKIKRENARNMYDCLIGLSGGLDSTYLAYYMKKEYNLRMLALHVDTGWNSETAPRNIDRLCGRMSIDLVVDKLNQDEFMDLQKAFFLSGVFSQDNPQDHMFMASLFKYAKKENISQILSGANFSTENILQKSRAAHIAADGIYLKDIHRKYGSVEIGSLPTISLFERYFKFRFIDRIKLFRPLDYMDFSSSTAIAELEDAIGYEYGGGKHYESVFTRFFQAYYLPHRYNFDKRKSHLSSLIVTNQITREKALIMLQEPLYDEDQMQRDIEYILDKMGISRKQFEEIMNLPPDYYQTFRTSRWIKCQRYATKFRRFLGE